MLSVTRSKPYPLLLSSRTGRCEHVEAAPAVILSSVSCGCSPFLCSQFVQPFLSDPTCAACSAPRGLAHSELLTAPTLLSALFMRMRIIVAWRKEQQKNYNRKTNALFKSRSFVGKKWFHFTIQALGNRTGRTSFLHSHSVSVRCCMCWQLLLISSSPGSHVRNWGLNHRTGVHADRLDCFVDSSSRLPSNTNCDLSLRC